MVFCKFFCVYFSGLNVVEVAHDNQSVVKKYVTNDLNLTNSYDSWYSKCVEYHVLIFTKSVYLSTNNVAKSMKKIAIGTTKAQGKTRFPELSEP